MSEYDFTLIFCPRWGVMRPWTAPAYLLEAVRSKGFRAQYLDYNVRLFWENHTPELWTENLQHQFWKTRDLSYFLDQIDLSEIKAPIVGFSLTETNILFSVDLARRLKAHDPGKTIIFGGHRIFFHEDAEREVPKDVCDAIVKGEGELTLIDILENGLNRNLGTYTPDGDKWVFNGERGLIRDLDTFHWPRYEDVNWNQFPMRQLGIMGSRGCINRCAFCNDIVRAGHKFRWRSAEHVADEMLYHKKYNDIGFMLFNDPLLNGHYPTLDRLCDILIKNNFTTPWAGNFAVRRNMPLDLIEKAKRAGFITAIIGLESGSNHVLKLMKKPSTAEDSEEFIDKLHKVGIKVELNLVIGFPGEREDDFKDTMSLVSDLAPKISQIVSICTLNVDRSYLWDNLEDYNVNYDTKDSKAYIRWATHDRTNTYEIRCDRARRLIEHANCLGLTHDRFDADIEQEKHLITIDEVKKNREIFLKIKSAHSGARTVYIWGTGKGGVSTFNALDAMGIHASGYIDNNPDKWGGTVSGLTIHSPSSLLKDQNGSNKPYVVIGSMYAGEITKQLDEMGFQKGTDYMSNLVGI